MFKISTAAKAVFLEAVDDAPNLELAWADSGYQGQLETSLPILCGFSLVIVKGTEPGFKLLPRRWVVERTFAWIGRNRRLSKDYEQLPEVSDAIVYVAMVHLMLRRLFQLLVLLSICLTACLPLFFTNSLLSFKGIN